MNVKVTKGKINLNKLEMGFFLQMYDSPPSLLKEPQQFMTNELIIHLTKNGRNWQNTLYH